MTRLIPTTVSSIASLGGGPIGAGWAAHFLARGYDVTSWLYDRKEEQSFRNIIATAWVSLQELGLAKGASLDRLTVTTDLQASVQDAQFVQESIPENLPLKQTFYQTLGQLVPEGVVIASSTSGLTMTDIQRDCATPERCIVAHPFNPPYLLPLVELVGGAQSDADVVQWAHDFYRFAGKQPLVMNKEIPGFIATRLQEALWREALHMVDNDEATPEQIDLALIHGPAARMALLGQCMAFHLGCGEGGMTTLLEHFGPALKLPWTRLEAPELTPSLRDKMIDGCNRMAAGRDLVDLAADRDRGLIAVMKAVQRSGLVD